MPLYEYRCNDCQSEFELIHKSSQIGAQTCPTCGRKSLQRLTSRPTFHLKGGNWYKDLYSSASAQTTNNGGTKPQDKKEKTPKQSKSETTGQTTNSAGEGS